MYTQDLYISPVLWFILMIPDMLNDPKGSTLYSMSVDLSARILAYPSEEFSEKLHRTERGQFSPNCVESDQFGSFDLNK